MFQSCLSVSKATDPGSTSCEKAKFLINSDLLYDVVVFGLADKDSKVGNIRIYHKNSVACMNQLTYIHQGIS